jgi:small-conductance mechanosensitive channel
VDSNVPHQKVEELLYGAAEKTSGIINEPKSEIFGEDLRDKAITYELLTHTNSPRDLKKIKSELIYNIQEAFQEAGLNISMPAE